MASQDRLSTIEALWSAWEDHGRSMTAEQWELPTRLGDWQVRALYAHAAGWPHGFSRLVDRVHDVAPTHSTAAALLRELNSPDGLAMRQQRQAAAMAQQDADTYSTEEMVDQFATVGPQALATARRLCPVVVDYAGLAMLDLEEAVGIGIMEATVHLLDLRHALGLTPEVPDAALTHTADLLAQMAPTVDFIEVATGRSDATLFPVLT